ncbi:MAG: hypothetical protein L0Y38_11090 [Methylococcaceae bacterium]|nr:hypothetical protein [Methylococcaceae bacterium]
MSEYQYYEFAAVDRPLTSGQQVELRGRSSRAIITAKGSYPTDWLIPNRSVRSAFIDGAGIRESAVEK